MLASFKSKISNVKKNSPFFICFIYDLGSRVGVGKIAICFRNYWEKLVKPRSVWEIGVPVWREGGCGKTPTGALDFNIKLAVLVDAKRGYSLATKVGNLITYLTCNQRQLRRPFTVGNRTTKNSSNRPDVLCWLRRMVWANRQVMSNCLSLPLVDLNSTFF